jgi:membrane protein required for colicin V production
MNLLDMIIICTMIFFIVKGILRGFLREVASLAGVILGILLANHFQPRMTEVLKAYVPASGFLPIISFALLFGAVLVICNFAGYGLSLLFQKAFLGWVDRTLGSGFAVVKGVIITYLVIVILTFFLPAQTPLIAQSKTAPWIISSYQALTHLIAPDQYEKWRKRLLGIKERTAQAKPEKPKDAPRKDESN